MVAPEVELGVFMVLGEDRHRPQPLPEHEHADLVRLGDPLLEEGWRERLRPCGSRVLVDERRIGGKRAPIRQIDRQRRRSDVLRDDSGLVLRRELQHPLTGRGHQGGGDVQAARSRHPDRPDLVEVGRLGIGEPPSMLEDAHESPPGGAELCEGGPASHERLRRQRCR